MGKFDEFSLKIKTYVRWLRKFLGHDIWQFNLSELSKAQALFIRDLKVVLDALRNFADEKIGLQSVALSYFCTLAAVPLVAVCFAVTSGFGLENVLRDALYSADISQTVIDTLLTAASNIINASKAGLFGVITALSFVWLVIWMMNRVEKVFNNVWHVRKPKRKALKSYGIDIIIMILIPFVVLIFFAGTVVYSHVLDLIPNSIGVTDRIKSFLGWVIFGGVAVMTLSAMYKFIPATHVNYRFALKGALWAGIAFTIFQYLYLETQVLVTNINAVYGAVAALPLFMMWLRFGWLIILYGAQFSYSFQTVDEMDKARAVQAAQQVGGKVE
ncbi:MAG: YihY/virulence factor BrkB family protein [Bacteroidales bacterium]|nr:YihY/virulence factor BrkB family protein [Bacteroidales bacterium]